MKFGDILGIIGIAIGIFIIATLEQQNKKLDAKLEQPIAQDDYLVVGEKELIEAVIAEYYEQHKEVITVKEKSSPTLKKWPILKKKTNQEANLNISSMETIDKIAIYIKKKEGFRARAYKDNTQYSNGFGTRAKNSREIIDKKEANIRLYKHIKKVILPSFKDINFRSMDQVYAAIDFSYNLGQNRFKREVVNKSGEIECHKMMSYNKMRDKHGNLVYNEGLAQRRFENFLSCISYEIEI